MAVVQGVTPEMYTSVEMLFLVAYLKFIFMSHEGVGVQVLEILFPLRAVIASNGVLSFYHRGSTLESSLKGTLTVQVCSPCGACRGCQQWAHLEDPHLHRGLLRTADRVK